MKLKQKKKKMKNTEELAVINSFKFLLCRDEWRWTAFISCKWNFYYTHTQQPSGIDCLVANVWLWFASRQNNFVLAIVYSLLKLSQTSVCSQSIKLWMFTHTQTDRQTKSRCLHELWSVFGHCTCLVGATKTENSLKHTKLSGVRGNRKKKEIFSSSLAMRLLNLNAVIIVRARANALFDCGQFATLSPPTVLADGIEMIVISMLSRSLAMGSVFLTEWRIQFESVWFNRFENTGFRTTRRRRNRTRTNIESRLRRWSWHSVLKQQTTFHRFERDEFSYSICSLGRRRRRWHLQSNKYRFFVKWSTFGINISGQRFQFFTVIERGRGETWASNTISSFHSAIATIEYKKQIFNNICVNGTIGEKQ